MAEEPETGKNLILPAGAADAAVQANLEPGSVPWLWPEATAKNKRRVLALSLGLFLFAVYLFSYRGGFHSIDEVSMFATTESLVKFGRFNTDQIAWTQWTTSQAEAQGFFGRDGHVYSKKGLGLSLAQAPLYWLALMLPGVGMLQTVSVLNAIITAASGLLLFMFVERLHFSTAAALATSLIYGLATIAFIYAKYLFSEPLAGLLLLLAAYMLLAYRQEAGLRHVVIAGLAAGASVLTRANNLFLLPVFGLYLVWIIYARPDLSHSSLTQPGTSGPPPALSRASFWRSIRPFIAPVGVFILAIAVAGAILMAYNALRSGDPTQTGYDLTLFSPNILLGLYKLLFSPLRGLFIYSPILLLSLPGWWLLRKTHAAEAWLCAGLAGITIGLFSAWSSGEGLSWGSRFLVPIIPFLTICLAPIVEQFVIGQLVISNYPSKISHLPSQIQNPKSKIQNLTYSILLLLSLAIQFLGVVINPWVYLAQLQADFGGEFFLENTAALYDFRYSQIAGQLRAWDVSNSDLAWWQPWGFDGLTFGLSLALVIGSGWLLWRTLTPDRDNSLTRRLTYSLIPLTIAITYMLLARTFGADRQFGPPDEPYTRALNAAVAQTGDEASLVTVHDTHYHIAMNRFKARLPLVGFARQTGPLPETALPLLEAATAGRRTWLVTIGLPPAAPDNAAEQWLVRHAFKAGDTWFDEVRLVGFGTTPATATRPIEVTLAETLRLLEIHLTEPLRPGQVLPVEFVWQALDQPRVDYNLFLQLLDARGAPVAQHDSPPQGGYAPTSTWPPGARISDRHGLSLPPDLSPGSYRLIAGLYDPATGQRLAVSSGGDFVDLGRLKVE
jgi:hypothetical protein